jgi:MEDS: MEthanogen/methylotroph, DcmR Sensory domain
MPLVDASTSSLRPRSQLLPRWTGTWRPFPGGLDRFDPRHPELPHVSNGFISDLVSYEARVARWTRAYRQIGVCLYDLDRFGGDVIVSMVNSHAKV